MTDFEISKALALAIGWTTVVIRNGHCRVWVAMHSYWRIFDYRDWNVIGPIAERYNAFPVVSVAATTKGQWCAGVGVGSLNMSWSYADTPQKAIALAVIEGAKK